MTYHDYVNKMEAFDFAVELFYLNLLTPFQEQSPN